MGLDDILISTGVDQLIRLVKEKKKIELEAAAKELKLPSKMIEDWSRVLESEGLITIEYQLTRTNLIWQTPKEEYIEEKKGKIGSEAKNTKKELEKLLVKVEKGGEELVGLQGIVENLETAKPINSVNLEKQKKELQELEKKYSIIISSSSGKLEGLRKKILDIESLMESRPKERRGHDEIKKEIETLHKFEETLKTQLEDIETFFDALKTRLDTFKTNITANEEQEKTIQVLKKEVEEIKEIRDELIDALNTIANEQKNFDAKIDTLGKKIVLLMDETGIGPEKKKIKITEISKIAQEAQRQKDAAVEQINDALVRVKKRAAKFQEIAGIEAETESKLIEIKKEYFGIKNEVEKTAEELKNKRLEISGQISENLKAYETIKNDNRISQTQIKKTSAIINSLVQEQKMLENKVRLLLKESEVLELEYASAKESQEKTAISEENTKKSEEKKPSMLIDKVRLSEEEAEEFEHKRQELRELIRRMWKDHKGSNPPA